MESPVPTNDDEGDAAIGQGGQAGEDQGRGRQQGVGNGPRIAEGRVEHRALLDRGDPRRDRDDHARAEQLVAPVDIADEVAEHGLGDVEVGDDAVLERSNGRDVAWRPSQHVLGVHANGLDDAAPAARILANRHNGRFVQHDAVSPRVNQGVGGAKINRQVIREITQNILEHGGKRPRIEINALI